MTHNHTYENILQHIKDYLHTKLEDAPQVTAETHFTRDLNIGSLQVYEIVEELEETYDIVVPLELLYKQQVQTVADLAQEVVRLLEAQG